MTTNENRYAVHFRDCAGNEYMDEGFTFRVPTGGEMLKSLEEQLYIRNELTPLEFFNCRTELATRGFTFFTYHRLEVLMVTYMWDNSHDIQVYECSPEVTAMILNS